MPPPPEHDPNSSSVDAEVDEAAGASQTDWSMIMAAGHGVGEPSANAWEALARRYWPAIYAYIRSSGRDVHEAADLTQGFVCDVMLGRHLVQSADPERGRFRTFLHTALRNYLAERHRYQSRRKRSPAGGEAKLVDLDRVGTSIVPIEPGGTPESAFDAQWGVSLVRRVLDRVQTECLAEALAAHWTVFELRVVRPVLFGERPVGYASLVDRLDLKDAAQAANMMITVKRRFARVLLEEVGRTVDDQSEVDDELRALMAALERSA